MKRLLLAALAILLLTGTFMVQSDAANPKRMFEGWLHPNRPNVYNGNMHLGIRHLDFISPNNKPYLVGLYTVLTALPPTAWYDALAANYTHPDNMLLLDMESFPTSTTPERTAAIAKFVTMYQEMKTRRPDLQIGFYAYPHMGRYSDVLGNTPQSLPGGADYLAFQAMNDEFAPMWAVVDFIAPTVYYPYNRTGTPGAPIQQPWIHNYFYHNLLDVLRCRTAYGHNQPIYTYVWHSLPNGEDIDMDVWDDMIRTTYTMVDGLILWSINTQPTWDDNTWWWKNFLARFPFSDPTILTPLTPMGLTVARPPTVTDRSSGTAVAAATSITWNHTNSASVNAALTVCVPFQDSDAITWTATYNSVPMTLIANHHVTTDGVAAFVLTAPPTGTFPIVVSAGATTITNMNAFGVSLQGVHQTTPNRSPYTGSAASGSFGLTVANTQDGDMVVACDVLIATSAPVEEYQDRTTTNDPIIGASARSGALSTKYATGTSTTTGLTATSSGWRGIAFALQPPGP